MRKTTIGKVMKCMVDDEVLFVLFPTDVEKIQPFLAKDEHEIVANFSIKVIGAGYNTMLFLYPETESVEYPVEVEEKDLRGVHELTPFEQKTVEKYREEIQGTMDPLFVRSSNNDKGAKDD